MCFKILILLLLPLLIISMDKQKEEALKTNEFKLPHPKKLLDPKTKKPFKCRADAWDAFWHQAYQRDYLFEQTLVRQLPGQKLRQR
jgi:hypothetical protein